MPTIEAADLFAGAGGASTALSVVCGELGYKLNLRAVNHWPIAVQTHALNHPKAQHYCEPVDAVNPRQAVPGGKLDLLLAGPECVGHSKARGGKPVNDQSRASAWCILRWATALEIKTILIENVTEFTRWGPLGSDGRPLKSRQGETFAAFIASLRSLGYRVDWRVLNSADYGDPTTRERLFIQARRGRRPIRWPEPTHAPGGASDLFGRREPWRPARDVIDWTTRGESIFTRKRPLRPNTIRRIAEGLRRFGGKNAEPFLVMLYGTGRVRDIDRPLPAVTGQGEHIGLCEPFITATGGTEGQGTPRSVGDPLRTITATNGGNMALVEPFVFPLTHAGENRSRSVDHPLPTITGANRGELGLCEPFLVPTNFGERPGQKPRTHGLDEPLPTVVGSGSHALVEPFVMGLSQSGSNGARMRADTSPLPTITSADDMALCQPYLINYHGNGAARSVEEPIRTLDGNDRYGLVQPVRLDILFRMLLPAELARGMGFPEWYRFCGNRGDVVKQIGNAWSHKKARAIIRELLLAA